VSGGCFHQLHPRKLVPGIFQFHTLLHSALDALGCPLDALQTVSFEEEDDVGRITQGFFFVGIKGLECLTETVDISNAFRQGLAP
jgi:hypothetical protein